MKSAVTDAFAANAGMSTYVAVLPPSAVTAFTVEGYPPHVWSSRITESLTALAGTERVFVTVIFIVSFWDVTSPFGRLSTKDSLAPSFLKLVTAVARSGFAGGVVVAVPETVILQLLVALTPPRSSTAAKLIV